MKNLQVKMKNRYVYELEWPVYSLGISERNDRGFRFCASSYIESKRNYLEVITLNRHQQELVRLCSTEHLFPATKVMFIPSNYADNPDLLMTGADFLRVYRLTHNYIKKKSVFDTNKNKKFRGPVSSFDWCRIDLSRVISSSVDTTITYWDMKKEKLVSQLIGHEGEVFDVNFRVHSKFNFATCGADGTVRMFDMRRLKTSTLLYDNKKSCEVVRVRWNKLIDNILSVFLLDSKKILLLDQRMPTRVIHELEGHTKAVNSMDWAPHSGNHLMTGGDDQEAFIWDIAKLKKSEQRDPVLAYPTKSPVNQVRWSHLKSDWVVLATTKTLELLKI